MRLPAHLTPAEDAALAEFVRAARARLGAELCDAVHFGSRARGQGDEDSDLDVALIVSAAGYACRRELHDLAFDIGLAHGVMLAPTVIEKARLDELARRERRFAAELARDGIRLP